MANAVRRFTPKPTFAIRFKDTMFEPYTMALGGVATGIMNAHEAANVAGNISNTMGVLVATARLPMTGSSTFAVAVFEVISVRKVTKSTTTNITA